MMSETVVTVHDGSTNANNPRGPTIKTEPGQQSFIAGITLNFLYFRTIPGIIKLVQLVCGFLCCAFASHADSSLLFSMAVFAFIATIIWTFVYMLSIRENLRMPINWMLTETLNTAIWTVALGISVLYHLIAHIGRPGWTAASIFGIFDGVSYAAGTYFLWMEWKNSQAQ
jgi:hypothetical protein